MSLPTAVLAAALAGAAGFALGRSTSPSAPEPTAPPRTAHAMDMGGGNDLPPGHPNVANMGSSQMPPAGGATITWTAPARWKSVPNPTAMRIATYEIPRVAGDSDDPELSVTQAGGGVQANIDRWIGQFSGGQSTVKRTTKTVKGMKVTIVEIEGTYSGGMSGSGGAQKNWALLGAIVETKDMPHFFKMIGPEKSVRAARAELEAMLDTIAPKS